MNDETLTPDEERLLDRLVDGDLTETERRALLLRLERSGDGWRRCALAFLEAQAWRGEAKSLVHAPPAVAARPQAARYAHAGWLTGSAWTAVALAAGLLLAATWVTLRDRNGANVVRVPDGATVEVVDASPAGAAEAPQNLQLVVDEGAGAPNVVEVPLVEADRININEALFGPWSQTIPPEVLRVLEQNGHQVVRQRTLMPVDLRDGRRIVVPMDQVEIRPVGTRSFQ